MFSQIGGSRVASCKPSTGNSYLDYSPDRSPPQVYRAAGYWVAGSLLLRLVECQGLDRRPGEDDFAPDDVEAACVREWEDHIAPYPALVGCGWPQTRLRSPATPWVMRSRPRVRSGCPGQRLGERLA